MGLRRRTALLAAVPCDHSRRWLVLRSAFVVCLDVTGRRRRAGHDPGLGLLPLVSDDRQGIGRLVPVARLACAVARKHAAVRPAERFEHATSIAPAIIHTCPATR